MTAFEDWLKASVYASEGDLSKVSMAQAAFEAGAQAARTERERGHVTLELDDGPFDKYGVFDLVRAIAAAVGVEERHLRYLVGFLLSVDHAGAKMKIEYYDVEALDGLEHIVEEFELLARGKSKVVEVGVQT